MDEGGIDIVDAVSQAQQFWVGHSAPSAASHNFQAETV
jgi:hypothetical protein